MESVSDKSQKDVNPYDTISYAEYFAFKKDATFLQHISEQTEEMCLDAVKRVPYALTYVKNQTKRVCLEAVKRDPWALLWVRDQTLELCLEAVKLRPTALLGVRNQTEEICLKAVKRYGMALEYVKNQTHRVCLEAIKQNINSTFHIRELTLKFCLDAIRCNDSFSNKMYNASLRSFLADFKNTKRLPNDLLRVLCTCLNSIVSILGSIDFYNCIDSRNPRSTELSSSCLFRNDRYIAVLTGDLDGLNILRCSTLKFSIKGDGTFDSNVTLPNIEEVEYCIKDTLVSLIGRFPIKISSLIFSTTGDKFTEGYIRKSVKEIGSYDILVY